MDTNSKIEPLDLSTFTGFTPGPWAAFNRDGEYLDESGLGWDVIGPPESSMDRGQFERGADARLIVAAPDLLAECRRLRAELASMKDAESEQHSKRCDAEEEAERQRDEIARLRKALDSIIGTLAFEIRNEDAPYGEVEHAMADSIKAARAALAQEAA